MLSQYVANPSAVASRVRRVINENVRTMTEYVRGGTPVNE